MNVFERVYDAVSLIPKGKVTTYGAIARFIGIRNARIVGYALHVNPKPYVIPCHRVVNAKGELSKAFAFGGENVQCSLLIDEGVQVVDGKVDLAEYFCFPKENIMKYDLVIFDLDGTLLNTIDDLADGVNYAMREFSFPTHSVDKVKKMVGNGVRNLITRALPDDKKDMIDIVLPVFKEYYSAHSNDKTAPYAGIVELLQKIKANGMKTAILSNKFDGAVKALSKEYFGDLIDLPMGEGKGIKVKPDPEGMNFVLEYFDVNKSRCLYVGDSEVDVVTALGVDIDYAIVTWGFRDRDVLENAGATVFADSVDELEKIILE